MHVLPGAVAGVWVEESIAQPCGNASNDTLRIEGSFGWFAYGTCAVTYAGYLASSMAKKGYLRTERRFGCGELLRYWIADLGRHA